MLVLGRIALALVGYVIAALAASLTMHILLLPQFGLAAANGDEFFAAVMFVTIPIAAVVIAAMAFLPSALAIFIAEAWSFRSWLYFTIAAGLIGLASAVGYRGSGVGDLVDFGTDLEIFPPGIPIDNNGFIGVAVAAGIVAGFAYWLIAGRSAGSWRKPATSPARSGS